MATQKKIRQSGVSARVSDRARIGSRPQREEIWSRSNLYRFLLFAAFSASAILVAFSGRDFSGPPLVEGQVADQRVVADFPFRYQSRLATAEKLASVRERVPPVYRVSTEPYEEFEQFATRLDVEFSQIERQLRDLDAGVREERIRAFAEDFLARSSFKPDLQSVFQLLSQTTSLERNRYLRLGLASLRRVYLNGILDPDDPNFRDIGSYQMIQIQTDDGQITNLELQRRLDALVSLRLDLIDLDLPDAVFNSLYRFLEAGIQENLIYDRESSRREEAAAVAATEPVIVTIAEGETLVSPGETVAPRAYEAYSAYLTERDRRELGRYLLTPEQEKRVFQALLLLMAFALFTNTALTEESRSVPKLALVLFVVLFNILLLRLFLDLQDSSFFVENPSLLATLRFGVPVAFAPILISILLRPGSAIAVAFLVSMFAGLIHGNTVSVFLSSLVASVIGIFNCKNVRFRANVVRACVGTGAAMAVFVSFEGLLSEVPIDVLGRGTVLALAMGFLTGVAILGVLPYLERTFRITTDITLLEYTDFNHPLLRQMQLEAPGTYHHSLMVASLSENAAAAIGANALLCRATSLFHDVGKLVKPEYFIENQQGGANPLAERNPSMSALIIKSHVKEGLAIARRYGLPEPFLDTIEQHHGTSLISFFYHEARKRQSEENASPFGGGGIGLNLASVEESTYRYDGPRPQRVETAVILIADSVEAASRSLSKINAQSIEELIDGIIRSRLDDEQFNECPITTQQLAVVAASLSRTLLNSLHARIKYPAPESEPKVVSAKE